MVSNFCLNEYMYYDLASTTMKVRPYSKCFNIFETNLTMHSKDLVQFILLIYAKFSLVCHFGLVFWRPPWPSG